MDKYVSTSLHCNNRLSLCRPIVAPQVKTAVILYYTYCSAAGISDGVNKVLYEHMFKCESFNLKHFRWSVRIFPLKHELYGCQACTGITGRPSPAISMEFPQNPGAELASVGGLKSQSLLTSRLGTVAVTHHLIRIKCFSTESQ